MSISYEVYLIAQNEDKEWVNIGPRSPKGKLIPLFAGNGLNISELDTTGFSKEDAKKFNIFEDIALPDFDGVSYSVDEFLEYCEFCYIPIHDLDMNEPTELLYLHREFLRYCDNPYSYFEAKIDYYDADSDDHQYPNALTIEEYAQLSDQHKECYIPKIVIDYDSKEWCKFLIGRSVLPYFIEIEYRQEYKQICDPDTAVALIRVSY